MTKIQLKSRVFEQDGSILVTADVIKPKGVAFRASISTGKNQALADRLAAAVDAGVVFTELEVATDVFNEKYVAHKTNVMGRYLNADLRRLGF